MKETIRLWLINLLLTEDEKIMIASIVDDANETLRREINQLPYTRTLHHEKYIEQNNDFKAKFTK